MRGEILAALDLGTNNCRLLVVETREDGFEVVDSFSRIVRLGEGLAATGRLGERAMARTLAALKVCARIIARHRAERVRCVATEACRRAVNGGEFIDRVARVTGIELEILGQEEEARLAMLGCMPLVEADSEQLLMVDIGGGSTEIMWLDRFAADDGADPGHSISLPMGVVTLSESYGPEIDAGGYDQMVGLVHDELRSLRGDRLQRRGGAKIQMLGTSGTVTTLAAVHLGLRRYDRRRVDGLSLPFASIEAVSRRLRRLDNDARAAHPCIGVGRADLVVAGSAILEAVHGLWPVERLHVADRGLREGILGALMGQSLRQVLVQPVRAA
ncbi:MAG TPA: Ppx/GppA phosphatase family protein [Geminicoccaceae bacterium]|nr:Ppx/GppA phosphatase family protein [Geminicoccus sp.]HMU53043.1 Ppx/GppA phosphatase family protein [Geminicoccaceae bacterium]